MPSPDRNRYVHNQYTANVQILIDRFPTVFDRDNPLPLEIGVFETLIAMPNLGMGDDELECVLLCWTARREYCRACVLLGQRYNMEGQPIGPIGEGAMENYQRRYDSFIRRGML